MRGAGEGDPRRTSRVGVPIVGFRKWLSFPQAQRDGEAQWTPKYRHMERSHATTRGKAPPPPPPLAFFIVCRMQF